ncbi:MAG: hypothetical protein ACRCY5_00675 [Phocaeicola sp.]
MKKTFRFSEFPLLLLAIILTGITSCQKEDQDLPQPSIYKHLLSYTKVDSLTADQIKESLTKLKPKDDIPTDDMKYGVDYYKVTYKSSYVKNQELVESGLVIIPREKKEMTPVVYNHYTIYPKEKELDTPSFFDNSKLDYETVQKTPFEEVRLFGLPFASLGHLVVMADYSGYGESKQVEHLYVCNEALAKDSYNLLEAAYELAETLNLQVEKKVSLMGWSEGGAVSMFLQKLMEKNNDTVVANYCVAGAYAPEVFIDILKDVDVDAKNINYDIISWGALAHLIYNNIPVNTAFNDGITGVESLIAVCEKTPTLRAIFNDETRKNGYDNIAKLSAESNSAAGWVPKSNLYLFHAQSDEVVPFVLSQIAMGEFVKSGTPKERITTYFPKDGDHRSTVSEMLKTAIKNLK